MWLLYFCMNVAPCVGIYTQGAACMQPEAIIWIVGRPAKIFSNGWDHYYRRYNFYSIEIR